MSAATLTMGQNRVGLDQLIRLMVEPCFVMQHRRIPSMVERAGHVSPTMLALEPPRSRYVRRWKRHAKSCSSCAAIFRHVGYSLN